MRILVLKAKEILNLDKIGMSLSFLCALHCVLTPFVMLSLPIMARYYLAHPYFHWLLALFIVPVGLLAFLNGYKHHHRIIVFWLGVPGLMIVGLVPLLFHSQLTWWSEPILMILGSALLISSHWLNRRSCSCEIHGQGK